jgi:pimeloyl-ACP methyl ester carboxylesterase
MKADYQGADGLVGINDGPARALEIIPVVAHVIWGAHDAAAGQYLEIRQRLFREARPDAEIRIIPDAGHWVAYEAAAQINAVLWAFSTRRTLRIHNEARRRRHDRISLTGAADCA